MEKNYCINHVAKILPDGTVGGTLNGGIWLWAGGTVSVEPAAWKAAKETAYKNLHVTQPRNFMSQKQILQPINSFEDLES